MEREVFSIEGKPEVYHYPLFALTEDELNEKQYPCKHSGYDQVDGSFTEVFFRDIHLGYTHMRLNRKVLVELNNCKGFVQLFFSVRCKCAYKTGDCDKVLASFEPHQHNMLYFADGSVRKEIEPDVPVEAIQINLSLDFLLRHLPRHAAALLPFTDSIAAGIATRLSKNNLPITPRMMLLLNELLHCPYTGYYKRMFVKAKVVELLMLQFEQHELTNSSPATPKLKEADIEKMHHARDILLKNLESPYSLVELAHLVGTNEYYLKKHFKEVFGTTVFGYLNNYRMEQAKQMLLQGDKKVGDIATALGFKYAAHFTSAFKKHFGCLPQQCKS